MQRVQRGALHSQHASPGTINGGPRPLPCAAARQRPGHPAAGLQALQLGPRKQQQQQQRRRWQQRQRLPFTCRAAAGSADAGGDPSIIPKARASTPVQPSAIDSPGAPTGGAGNSTGPSPGSTGPPSSSSYSSYYKSQNTRFPSYPGGGAGVGGAGSGGTTGGAPTAPAGGSSSRHGSPTPATAAAAAAAAAFAAPPAAPAAADGAAAHAAAAAAPPPPPPEATVDDALKKAQEALAAAQTSLEASSSRSGLQGLASAALARAAAAWLAVRPAVIATTLAVAMVASHAFGLALQWAAATLSALGIAAWGHRRGSLTPSGAVAAATVGLATLGCSLRLGATLLAFFFANSRIAWLRRTRAAADAGPVPGVSSPPPPPQRDWALVLANSGLPTLLAIGYGALAGCLDLPLGALPGIEPWRADLITLLMGGFLGYYAARCGDTWAGELGSLSPDTPRLVTTLKPVRPGTAGGVTLLGLSASLAGGLFVGAVFYLAAAISPTLWVFDLQRQAALAQWRLVPLGLMAGLVGSFLDSVIGATLRFTGWDVKAQRLVDRPGPDVVHISGLPLLPGAAVNVISASLTSVATALVALRMFA